MPLKLVELRSSPTASARRYSSLRADSAELLLLPPLMR